MSLSVDGVWKAGVWATTAWADGVWREGEPPPPPPPVQVDSSPAVFGSGGIQDRYWRDVEKRYAKKKREAKKKSKKAVEIVEELAAQELALSEAIEQLRLELEAARIKNAEVYVELLKLKLEMVTAREAAIEADDEDEALFLGE